MNDPRDPRSRLLADTLQQGDWADGPAAAMAQRAARHARRHRLQRKSVLALAAAAAISAALILSSHSRVPTERAPATPPVTRGYEIMSDDELVAQLPDEAILVLPQENGTKKVVLLDR